MAKIEIKILQNLLQANDAKAAEIRALLQQKKILMLNLISSPGSGKTTLLEKTLPLLKEKYRVAVIEGDVETAKDAERLEKCNVPIALINTSGACHLESISIAKAFSALDLNNLDIIFVENVGNLVCPAEFDIGEDYKIALVSTPEGEDKPIKYPLLFREAALVLLNKIDLIEHLNFDRDAFYHDIDKIHRGIPIIETSCKNKSGFAEWLAWIEEKITEKKM